MRISSLKLIFASLLISAFVVSFTEMALGAAPVKNKKTKKDSLGYEYYTRINVDVANGGFTSGYLPFDVPFILQGDVPKDVYRVAVIYGRSKYFDDSESLGSVKTLNKPLRDISDSVNNITDPIGLIQSTEANDKISIALWDQSEIPLEKVKVPVVPVAEGEADLKKGTKFFLEIKPLQPNKSYRFFIHFYSKRDSGMTKPIVKWMVDKFIDTGVEACMTVDEDPEDDKKYFHVQYESMITEGYRDALIKELDDFVKNGLYYRNINVGEARALKTETALKAKLIKEEFTLPYASLDLLSKEYNSNVDKQCPTFQTAIRISDLGEKFFPNISDKRLPVGGELVYNSSTYANQFYANMVKVVDDVGTYRNGVRNFNTDIPGKKMKLSAMTDSKEIKKRIKNIELYQKELDSLQDQCFEILYSSALNLGILVLSIEENEQKEAERKKNITRAAEVTKYIAIFREDKRILERVRDSVSQIDNLLKLYVARIANYKKRIEKEKDDNNRLALLEAQYKIEKDRVILDNRANQLISDLPQGIPYEMIQMYLDIYKDEIKEWSDTLVKYNEELLGDAGNIKIQQKELAKQLIIWKVNLNKISIDVGKTANRLALYAEMLDTLDTHWTVISEKLIEDDLSHFYQLGGFGGNDYLSRADYYISADIGFAHLNLNNDPGVITPYFGVNFNLFPINKEAHYNLFSLGNHVGKRRMPQIIRGMSLMLGLTFIDFNDTLPNRSSVFRSSSTWKKLNLLTGVGLRLSDHSRLSAGYSWTYFEENPDLDGTGQLSYNWFVSLSLDVDVKKQLGAISNIFPTNRIPK